MTNNKLIYALACSSVPQNQYCSLALPNELCAISSAYSKGKQFPHLRIKKDPNGLIRIEFIDTPWIPSTETAHTLNLKNLDIHIVEYINMLPIPQLRTRGDVFERYSEN